MDAGPYKIAGYVTAAALRSHHHAWSRRSRCSAFTGPRTGRGSTRTGAACFADPSVAVAPVLRQPDAAILARRRARPPVLPARRRGGAPVTNLDAGGAMSTWFAAAGGEMLSAGAAW